MFMVFDATTGTYIGPFDSSDEAQFFVSEMDSVLEGGNDGMTLEELVHPQEFFMDNSMLNAMAMEF